MTKVGNKQTITPDLTRSQEIQTPKPPADKKVEAPGQKKIELDARNTGLGQFDVPNTENLAANPQSQAPQPGGGMLGLLKQKSEAPGGKQAWFGGDWKMASYSRAGDPGKNLWAEGGPLDKLDSVMRSMGQSASSRAVEAEPPGYLMPGLTEKAGGRGIAGTDLLSERRYSQLDVGRRALYEAAFGDPEVSLSPPVSGFDFMTKNGAMARPPAGSRVAVLLDGEPVEIKREQIGDTTYVDLMREGKKLSWDEARQAHFGFVDGAGRPVGDGDLTGELDVSWWGSGDGAAQAGLYLEQPKRHVMLKGVDADGKEQQVLFSPRDIEGLLAVVGREMKMDQLDMEGGRYNAGHDAITLKDGRVLNGEVLLRPELILEAQKAATRSSDDYRTVTPELLDKQQINSVEIKLPNGEHERIPADQISQMAVRTGHDVRPWVMREKLDQYIQQGGGMADVDTYSRVKPRPFTSAETTLHQQRPDWATEHPDEQRHDPSLRREWGETTVEFADEPRTYRYWTVYGKDDKPIDGGWFTGRGADMPPDFLFAPKDPDNFQWPDSLSSNPWVDVALVRFLYEQSTGDE